MGLNLYSLKTDRSASYLVPGYSFSMVHGYLFNPHLSVGIGSGLEVGGLGLSIPVVADVRYNILKKRVSPYVAASAGYQFLTIATKGNRLDASMQSKTDAAVANLAVGAKFGVGAKCYFITSMGYKLVTEFKSMTAHAFVMKFGVVY
jgi:hypothetical protein